MGMRTYEALSYRDNEVGLRVYRDGLLEARIREAATLPAELTRVYVRRVSRIAAGATATIGFALMALASLLGEGLKAWFGSKLVDAPLTWILLLTVAAVPVAALIARTAAHVNLLMVVRRDLRRTNDTRADVERLERSASTVIAEHADALETRSVAAPLVGWALCAPLTMHFIVYCFNNSANTLDHLTSDYEWWICASLLITAVAHLTLAALAVRFAKAVRAEQAGGPTPSAWAPLLWTTLAGCVPGVVLFLVPPILVAATGLVFIPATFAWMRRRVHDERFALEVNQPDGAELSAMT